MRQRPKSFRIWSGRWESNPRPKLGKLLYCHCTTPALVSIPLIIIHNRPRRSLSIYQYSLPFVVARHTSCDHSQRSSAHLASQRYLFFLLCPKLSDSPPAMFHEIGVSKTLAALRSPRTTPAP